MIGGVGESSERPQRRRRPRRRGRAGSDAERKALAKANEAPRAAPRPPPPGFAVLHADGGARGAPGPAAIGYLLEDEAGIRLAEQAQGIGTATAAVAEYRAMLAALQHAHALGLARVAARSDSRLLVGHLGGERSIRSQELLVLAREIEDLRMRIGTVVFEWVPAAANGAAHALVASVLA
jgi:ribonuclease HI